MKAYKHPVMEVDYFEDNAGLIFTSSGINNNNCGVFNCDADFTGEGDVGPLECEGGYDMETGECSAHSE